MKRVLAFLLSAVMCMSFGITAYADNNMILDIKKDNIGQSVSDTLYGISMEDVSFSCDGGLVSNLVNNGSFEYNDGACVGWDLANHVTITTDSSMNDKNPSSAVLHMQGDSVTIKNFGFGKKDSDEHYPNMSFEEGVKYDFSCFVRNINFTGTIGVYLDSSKSSRNVVQISNGEPQSKWTQLKANLKSNSTGVGSLAIVFDGTGDIQLDMVSLVPQNSYGYGSTEWKNTSLRPDIFERIKDLKPAFIRFPGGCLIEGDSLENQLSWKDTIGTLDIRKQNKNIYSDKNNGLYYNNTNAMGYHEYFQLCADISAEAVPVVSAGITCQQLNGYDEHVDALNKLGMTEEQWTTFLINERGYSKFDKGGMNQYTEKINSFGIKSEADFDKYIDSIAIKPGTDAFTNFAQDIVDLVEYANGDALTTYWGAQRALNGQEQPFNIKYLAIGNENYGEVYARNFAELKKIVNSAYPDITIISCASDETAEATGMEYGAMLDYHIKSGEEYMLSSDTLFDGTDRASAGVIVGDYACATDFAEGMAKNNIRSSVCEAVLSVGAERNSDIVKMIATAPAIAKNDANTKDKAMIWYDTFDTWVSPSYYTQMLFANNTGKYIIPTSFSDEDIKQSVTIDDKAQVIYIKLINTASSSKRVTVDLSGFEDITLVSNYSVSHRYKEAFNTDKKQAVAPEKEEIESSATGFDISLDGNSVNVVRVSYGDNDGTSLWNLPDSVDTKTRGFMPRSMKTLIIVLTIGFVLGTAIGYFVYTRLINKKANPSRNRKNKKKREE